MGYLWPITIHSSRMKYLVLSGILSSLTIARWLKKEYHWYAMLAKDFTDHISNMRNVVFKRSFHLNVLFWGKVKQMFKIKDVCLITFGSFEWENGRLPTVFRAFPYYRATMLWEEAYPSEGRLSTVMGAIYFL